MVFQIFHSQSLCLRNQSAKNALGTNLYAQKECAGIGVKMKKILVVFTGGTIGSRIHNSTIDVDEESGFYLLKLFQDKYHYDLEFDTLQPINILSENCTPNHWEILLNAMWQIDRSKYDGIIVTHGTDTLPYTSASISFIFNDTEIPIVITGSNYALDGEGSNGLNNFCCSVEFVINTALPGVYTIYEDNHGKNVVYLASRIQEADSYNDQFSGFGGDAFGEIRNGEFLLNNNRINPQVDRLKEQIHSHTGSFDAKFTFHNQIIAIRPYPGLDYSILQFAKKPKAILHSLYHSGTGCTDVADCSIAEFVKRCREEGIDLYLISFKNIDRDLYRTSREILENGAIPLQNISFEAAYAKLCIAYNQTEMPPQEYMIKELFFEYLPRFS
jgi:L-asparaginase/Glu-tRNA(Gln) amidotransferase subunit D